MIQPCRIHGTTRIPRLARAAVPHGQDGRDGRHCFSTVSPRFSPRFVTDSPFFHGQPTGPPRFSTGGTGARLTRPRCVFLHGQPESARELFTAHPCRTRVVEMSPSIVDAFLLHINVELESIWRLLCNSTDKLMNLLHPAYVSCTSKTQPHSKVFKYT